MLLKVVSTTISHIPRHGEKGKTFGETQQLFFDAAPKGNLDVIVLPNAKTLPDCFTNIIETRRAILRKK